MDHSKRRCGYRVSVDAGQIDLGNEPPLSADGQRREQRIDNRPVWRTLQGMKTIGVTDLRQRTAQILEELQHADEPVAILQRSRPAAYLISATQFEAERATIAAVWSLTDLTMSSAGVFDTQLIASAGNGVLMMRPVMPALAQTACWTSNSYISW